jgi:hypothetical protein
VPLSPEDGWAVGANGDVAVVRVGDYHVDWVRADGTIVSGPPVPYESVPVKTADKEAWAEDMAATGLMMMVTNDNGQMNARMRRGGGRGVPSLDRFQWPEVKPPFVPGSVRVDSQGNVWVERYVAAGERPVLDVFDGAGRHIAVVTIPAGCSLTGFGDGTVYLTRRDDLGFQWLERYDRPAI